MLTLLEYKPYGPQEKMFGLFQIHASPLVPQGQAFLFDQGAIENYFAIPVVSTELAKAFLEDFISPYKFKEKPFDYKERASIEFDLGNESGLR